MPRTNARFLSCMWQAEGWLSTVVTGGATLPTASRCPSLRQDRGGAPGNNETQGEEDASGFGPGYHHPQERNRERMPEPCSTEGGVPRACRCFSAWPRVAA